MTLDTAQLIHSFYIMLTGRASLFIDIPKLDESMAKKFDNESETETGTGTENKIETETETESGTETRNGKIDHNTPEDQQITKDEWLEEFDSKGGKIRKLDRSKFGNFINNFGEHFICFKILYNIACSPLRMVILLKIPTLSHWCVPLVTYLYSNCVLLCAPTVSHSCPSCVLLVSHLCPACVLFVFHLCPTCVPIESQLCPNCVPIGSHLYNSI